MNHDHHMVLAHEGSFLWLHLPHCPMKSTSEPCSTADVMSGVQELFAASRPPLKWTDVRAVVLSVNAQLRHAKLRRHLTQLPTNALVSTDHHRHHANYAFYTGPFASAAVVTMDDAGADGRHFALWRAARGARRVELLWSCETCWFGSMYYRLIADWGVSPERVSRASLARAPDAAYLRLVSEFLRTFGPKFLIEIGRIGDFYKRHPPDADDRLSAIQTAIEQFVVSELQGHRGAFAGVDGVAFAGGVAANTRLPHAVGEAFRLPVWVPALPGDGSLGFGALWALRAPERRPVVQFSSQRRLGVARARLDCRPYSAARVQQLLQGREEVAVVGPGDAIDGYLWQRPAAPRAFIGTPGRRTIVSCRPIVWDGNGTVAPDDQQVLMESPRAAEVFETSVPLYSPTHAFRLPVRPQFRTLLNGTSAVVAAVERGQDTVVDRLLEAARNCEAPLLFCRALREGDRARGLRHVLLDDVLCTAKPGETVEVVD